MSEPTQPTALRPGLIRVEWDQLFTPKCVTLDGEPLQPCTGIKMEWAGGMGRLPMLTVTQVVMPTKRGEMPAEVVSEAYIVPRKDWDEFEAWRKAQKAA